MLDAFSAAIEAGLRARYPDWVPLRETRPNGDGTEHVVLRVPRPVAEGAADGLVIDTARGEITVQCGRHFHWYFPALENPDDPDHAAVAFIDELLAEKVIFVRFEAAGRVLGGGSLDPEEARDLIAGRFRPRSADADRASLWSWRGTFDADIRLPAGGGSGA